MVDSDDLELSDDEYIPNKGNFVRRYTPLGPNRSRFVVRDLYSSGPWSRPRGQTLFSPDQASLGAIGGEMYKRSKRESAPVASTTSVNYEAANRKITLSGREFIQTLKSSSTIGKFESTYNLMRATDYTLFSWLGGIADKFENFKFSKLQFVYEPQCPTTTPGSIALWYDADPTHVAPANWNNMINTGANVHGAPWAKHVFPVPWHLFSARRSYYCKNEYDDANRKIINNFAVPTDPLEYYPGCYGFCSQDDSAAGTALGKIYLDYTVSLESQNIDSWTQTSLIADSPLSIEAAANAGTGLIVAGGTNLTNGTSLGVSMNAIEVVLMGYTLVPSDVLLYCPVVQHAAKVGAVVTSAGSQYFDVSSTGKYTCRHDIDLALFIGFNCSAAHTAKCRCGIISADGSKNYYIDSVDQPEKVLSAESPLKKIRNLYCTGRPTVPPSVVLDSSIFEGWALHFEKGDSFYYSVTGDANANVVDGFKAFFVPYVFDLQN